MTGVRRTKYVERLAVGAYFLEHDDARSGDFSPLRFVPPGKRLVVETARAIWGDL